MGDTIVYDEVVDESKPPVLPYNHDYSIKELISAEKGKIVCFSGKHYHANYFPNVGELRLVCVFNVEA